MVRLYLAGAAVAGLLAVVSPSRAEVTITGQAGHWDTFSAVVSDGGPENGRAICGMMTRGDQDRGFIIKTVAGEGKVFFQIRKESWAIPNGTSIPISMKLGSYTAWNTVTHGAGAEVDFYLYPNQMPEFEREFRSAASMTISFTSGSEADWVADLTGASISMNGFRQCIMANIAPHGPTQPYGAVTPPPIASGPTQPFGTPAPRATPTSNGAI